MYSSTRDIRELRRKGLPWLTAASFLVIAALTGTLLYMLIIRDMFNSFYKGTNIKMNEQSTPFLMKAENTSLDVVNPPIIKVEKTITPQHNEKPETFEVNECPTYPKSSKRQFRQAAVNSGEELCSEIGRNVLIRRGNAVDAAVATEVCMGALHPHVTGLGGGLIIIVDDKKSERTITINARETIPQIVRENIYNNNIKLALAKSGYSSVATPGALSGLWTAFKQFGSGRIAWQDLIMPSVDLLQKGFPLSKSLVQAIHLQSDEITAEKSMSFMYNTSSVEGQIVYNSQLAECLRRLATSNEPAHLFYRGEIADDIVHEMTAGGGLITKADLIHYEAKREEALVAPLSDEMTIKGPLPPSAFVIIPMIVGIMMKRANISSHNLGDLNYYTEMIKAQRISLNIFAEMIDTDFVLDTHYMMNISSRDYLHDISELFTESKTQEESYQWIPRDTVSSHINVVDHYGMTVSLSSSINDRFGAMIRSEKYGFIWNNQMKQFNSYDHQKIEDNESNTKLERNEFRTVMSPMLIFNNSNEVVLSLGITGSLNSVFAASQVILNFLLLGKDISSSIDCPRLFSYSEGAQFERGVRVTLPSALNSSGTSLNPSISSDNAIVHAVHRRNDGWIEVVCDYRNDVYSCSRGY